MIRFWEDRPHGWRYGTCNRRKARLHTRTRKLQILKESPGERGYRKPHWVNFKRKWWMIFLEIDIEIPTVKQTSNRYLAPRNSKIHDDVHHLTTQRYEYTYNY